MGKREVRSRRHSESKRRSNKRIDKKSHSKHNSTSESSSSSEDSYQKKRNTEKLAKKVVKHLKKHHSNVIGYENQDNIFHDSNLNEKFIWKKKIEKQIAEGASLKDLDAKAERERQIKRIEEIKKVRMAREEREAERAHQQDELSKIERARYAAEAMETAEKEEEFLLSQALLSCRARVLSNRERAIDYIARNLDPELLAMMDEDNLEAPFLILKNANMELLYEIYEGIQEYQELDYKDELHKEFWKTIGDLCNQEINLRRKQDEVDKAKIKAATMVVPNNPFEPEEEVQPEFFVEEEVDELLKGKKLEALENLEEEVCEFVGNGEGLDMYYWDKIKEKISKYILEAKLLEIQNALYEMNGEEIRKIKERKEEEKKIKKELLEKEMDKDMKENKDNIKKEEIEDNTYIDESLYDDRYSPEPITDPEILKGKKIITDAEDLTRLYNLRNQVLSDLNDKLNQSGTLDTTLQSADKYDTLEEIEMMEDENFNKMKEVAIRSMGEDESYTAFGGEVQLESRVYWWHEKYRPRKPKYFNRVHTGYEWNKYNQTHYDHDNPPPKVVQGYKFNIFYPDLIDKKTAPTYSLQRDLTDKESSTCILRFSAGPPYEDIAFKIVNKEWEYSHKKGFKCTFERGILHLYFNFKRQRYRR